MLVEPLPHFRHVGLFGGFAQRPAGGREVGVATKEGVLQHIPFAPRVQAALGPEFLEQPVADDEEIIPAQVIQVRITEDLAQGVIGPLRDHGAHDHAGDALHVRRAVPEAGKMLKGQHAAALLVVLRLHHVARIMEERSRLKQRHVFSRDAFILCNAQHRRRYIQCMLEAVVGAHAGQPGVQFRQDEPLGCLVVHVGSSAQDKVMLPKRAMGLGVPVGSASAFYFWAMARPAPRTPVLLFGVLALYILLQSAWWMWLLLSKDRDMHAVQQQLLEAGIVPQLPVRLPEHTLMMVLGEGLVFLVLLLVALWIILRTMRHELSLARQQRDFLMAASHELRTPIAALKLHLQTLERPNLDPGRREALAAFARADVDRLHALAEQVLLASRLDEHAVAPVLAPVDLAEATRGLLEEARRSFGHGHRIECLLPATMRATTDVATYRSVLTNLLENACKYSPSGSLITIGLQLSNRMVRLSVEDHGPGIAEEDRGRIFQKFYRGGNEATRHTRGTGLGLFIVRRLLEDMGGRVEYLPVVPHGSNFIALIPDRT